MSHLISLIAAPVAAAVLLGGIVSCQPSADELARWKERCENLQDVAAHAEWSRNGVSATCNTTVLTRDGTR